LSGFCASSWVCTNRTVTAVCGTSSGNSTISTTLVDQPELLYLDTVQYTITASICASSNGTLSNTVVAIVGAGYTDPTPASATDTDDLYPVADLSIVKSDNQNVSAPGASLTYTIIVTNTGPSDVRTGVSVIDSFSSFFIPPINWDCVATNGLCTSEYLLSSTYR